MMSTQLAIKL